MRIDTWYDRSSIEVELRVVTPYSSPTVGLHVFRADQETPVPREGGAVWPIDMPQVSGQDLWRVVVNCGDLDIEVGERLWIEVDFDDGDDNCRVFTSWATVRHG